jgi:hypothetical protein
VKVDNIICDLLHHIGILLTFGLCCPVLAISVSAYVGVYVLILLLVLGRFVKWLDTCSSEADGYSVIVAGLENASCDVSLYLSNCMWEVVFMTSVFFGMLCWDMAGDRTYWKNAAWILGVAVITPMVMWLCYVFVWKFFAGTNVASTRKHWINNSKISDNQSLTYDIELRPSVYDKGGDSSKDRKSISSSYQSETISPLTSLK